MAVEFTQLIILFPVGLKCKMTKPKTHNDKCFLQILGTFMNFYLENDNLNITQIMIQIN